MGPVESFWSQTRDHICATQILTSSLWLAMSQPFGLNDEQVFDLITQASNLISDSLMTSPAVSCHDTRSFLWLMIIHPDCTFTWNFLGLPHGPFSIQPRMTHQNTMYSFSLRYNSNSTTPSEWTYIAMPSQSPASTRSNT